MPNFANGIYYKEPSPKAPDFVVGGLSIKKKDFIDFLEDQDGEWVNLKILLSKEKKPYIAVDDWKPDKSKSDKPEEDVYFPPKDNGDLPF